MRRPVRSFWAALWCLSSLCQAAQLQVPDDRGITVQLSAPAARMISIAPHLTEIVYAAGAGSRLIAVSEFSDYPEEALRLPRVGDGARVDIERILKLKPDLVLAWKSGNQLGDIARLERLGIPVWVSDVSQLSDIPRLLRAVSALAGVAGVGERAAGAFERELDELRRRYGDEKPVRVFYEIWHQPLLTVNGTHLISDAIRLCGGMNVFASVSALTPSVSLESVLAARPQIALGGGSADGGTEFGHRWRTAPLAALRAIPAHYIPSDAIQRPSPRVIGGIRAICGHLESLRMQVNKSPR
jgi:iron complex transport system substrate-binding protein